jgi:DNA-binding ferritin-like protein
LTIAEKIMQKTKKATSQVPEISEFTLSDLNKNRQIERANVEIDMSDNIFMTSQNQELVQKLMEEKRRIAAEASDEDSNDFDDLE